MYIDNHVRFKVLRCHDFVQAVRTGFISVANSPFLLNKIEYTKSGKYFNVNPCWIVTLVILLKDLYEEVVMKMP